MGDQAPQAGWYQDPGGPGLRYWDGAQWTQHVRSENQPGAPAVSSAPPAGWNPDPTGRYELRYWDGSAWTDQVATRTGWRGTDPVAGAGATPGVGAAPNARPAPAPAPGPGPAWGPAQRSSSLPFRPVALVGGAMVIVSTFLAWLDTGSLGGESINAFKVPVTFLVDPTPSSDSGLKLAVILIVLGLVLAALSFLPAMNIVRRILGAITAGVAVWFFVQIIRAISEGGGGISVFSVAGAGVYVAFVGGILATAG